MFARDTTRLLAEANVHATGGPPRSPLRFSKTRAMRSAVVRQMLLSRLPRANLYFTTLALLAAITLGVAASTVGWKIPAALLAIVAIIGLGIGRPAAFIGVALIVRPLLVSSSEHKIHM